MIFATSHGTQRIITKPDTGVYPEFY